MTSKNHPSSRSSERSSKHRVSSRAYENKPSSNNANKYPRPRSTEALASRSYSSSTPSHESTPQAETREDPQTQDARTNAFAQSVQNFKEQDSVVYQYSSRDYAEVVTSGAISLGVELQANALVDRYGRHVSWSVEERRSDVASIGDLGIDSHVSHQQAGRLVPQYSGRSLGDDYAGIGAQFDGY